jgi:hypothetical protein
MKNKLEKVWIKLDKLFNYEVYKDYLLLSSDDFYNKYNYYGHSFTNFFQVRFHLGENILKELEMLLSKEDTCYLIPITLEKQVFEVQSSMIESFILENNIDSNDFIILSKNMNWSVVKNKHRYLIGIGDYIKKQMQKHTNMRFGDAKIMTTSGDNYKN